MVNIARVLHDIDQTKPLDAICQCENLSKISIIEILEVVTRKISPEETLDINLLIFCDNERCITKAAMKVADRYFRRESKRYFKDNDYDTVELECIGIKKTVTREESMFPEMISSPVYPIKPIITSKNDFYLPPLNIGQLKEILREIYLSQKLTHL